MVIVGQLTLQRLKFGLYSLHGRGNRCTEIAIFWLGQDMVVSRFLGQFHGTTRREICLEHLAVRH